jgi:ubiquinone/menaquinone biosynthesis C-methylase UbiE
MKYKISRIAEWWAKNPMTYGISHGTAVYSRDEGERRVELGSREFFEHADDQLYDWNRPLHRHNQPFAKIFPYEKYKDKLVLEIGCGMGGMAMLWAQRGAQMTATDLNPVAVEQTTRRFSLFRLLGTVRQENANALSFPDGSFHYVYSWGVLHHSPNLKQSLSELFRVLKPGGEFGVMLYNRHSLYYAYHVAYLEGFLHRESRFLSDLRLASRYGDGHREEGNPHTWPVTKKEIRGLFRPHTDSLKIRVLGTELDSTLKLLLPGLYFFIPPLMKKAWTRRFGWSFWISGRKDKA